MRHVPPSLLHLLQRFGTQICPETPRSVPQVHRRGDPSATLPPPPASPIGFWGSWLQSDLSASMTPPSTLPRLPTKAMVASPTSSQDCHIWPKHPTPPMKPSHLPSISLQLLAVSARPPPFSKTGDGGPQAVTWCSDMFRLSFRPPKKLHQGTHFQNTNHSLEQRSLRA